MLTDEDLRELLDSIAGEAPPPTPLPADLFRHEAPAPQKASIRWRRRMALSGATVAFVALVALVVPGSQIPFLEQHLVGGGSHDTASTAVTNGADATLEGRIPIPSGAGAGTGTATGAGGAGGAPGATGASGTATVSGMATRVLPGPPTDSARIVKNGALEIDVHKGTVTESVNRLNALVVGFGGYVSETKTTAAAQSGTQSSATLTVRVPAASFEQMITEASKLGDVRSTTTSGQDVTAQFTDIDAQLIALTGTRDQLLTVLGQANNVNDILAVQDRITQVQIQIDQLEGQKRLLTDQTSYGTLAVSLLEPGATLAVPPIDDNKDLGDAWRDARRNFGDAIENIVEASGTLAVVFLCGGALAGVGWFIFRASRRRMLTL